MQHLFKRIIRKTVYLLLWNALQVLSLANVLYKRYYDKRGTEPSLIIGYYLRDVTAEMRLTVSMIKKYLGSKYYRHSNKKSKND
jgi:hypothetical protein